VGARRTEKEAAVTGVQGRLAAAWIFVILNYLYCDIVGLMDAELLRQYLGGEVGGMTIDGGFLLGASVLMEIPIGMVLVSRVAGFRVNRAANIAAGTVMTAVQAATLFLGAPTAYYVFFSVIEIACTAGIVRCAWTWRAPEPVFGGQASR
jgi:hypothetical protein